MWTKEQQLAIETDGNLIVSAAAGAGKTAVMTERIVRIICDGARVDELLVVTFTRLAAKEMKQRIEKRLLELSENEADGEKKRRLEEAANDISHANISTIHSFLTNILRRSYHLVELDPAFRAADDSEIALIKNRALDEVLEDFYLSLEQGGDEAGRALYDALGAHKLLRELIVDIYEFISARPEPLVWLKNAVLGYDEGFDAFSEAASQQLISLARRDIDVFYSYANALYSNYNNSDGDEKLKYILNKDMEMLSEFYEHKAYERWYEALKDLKLIPLRASKGPAPDEIKVYREELKALIKKLQGMFFFPIKTEQGIAKSLYPAMERLYMLVEAFSEKYTLLKRRDALIDYADMEQLALIALQNDETKEEYRQKFKYIFVDEYQDTNLVQDSVISAVSRGDNVFMVGDVKQSIYRFRYAEPAVFLEKYNSYDGTNGRRIDLNANFRSVTSVLSAANSLFSKLMLGEVGEIDYSDNAELCPGAEAGSGYVELSLIETDEAAFSSVGEVDEETADNAQFREENSDKAEKNALEAASDSEAESESAAAEAFSAAEAEANFVADAIREIMETGAVKDRETGASRKPRFSDFAILMRKTSGTALRFVNTLSERGIPSSAELGDGYFDAIEVQIFLNLLRIIDNSRQDIPLVSVMRSPIGGFSEEELVRIRTDFEGAQFIDRLRAAAQGDPDLSWCRKARAFSDALMRYRKLSRLIGVSQLIGRLYDETRYYTYVSALPSGRVRRANLDLLIEKAAAFEKNGGRGLYGFINFMDSVKENTNLGAAQASGLDAVRVMSIHKSKGLEFPIVFITGLTGGFSLKEKRSTALIDGELGVGLKLSNKSRLKYKENGEEIIIRKPLFRRAIEAKDDEKLVAEEMRVLYVAMTRARERLYLVGAKKNMKKAVKDGAKRLTKYDIMNAGSYLDWLLGAYFPLGLNLSNAKDGLQIPIDNDKMSVYYRLSGEEKTQSVRLKKGDMLAWRERAKRTDHSALDERLDYRYPFISDAETPAKSNVTDEISADIEFTPAIPAFIKNEQGAHRLTAAERGTALHRFIMLLPLEALDREALYESLSSFEKRGLFTPDEVKSIDVGRVESLVSSGLYKRLLASDRVYREQEFSLIQESGALVQGVVDCCFVEDGGLILIDYKTTSTRERTPEEVALSYKRQLDAYAEALERLTGLSVREKWIYLTSVPGEFRVE